MRELSTTELDLVIGGEEPGPAERVGEAIDELMDNPGKYIGRMVDSLFGEPETPESRTDHNHPDMQALRSA